jgi:hypothetical protein
MLRCTYVVKSVERTRLTYMILGAETSNTLKLVQLFPALTRTTLLPTVYGGTADLRHPRLSHRTNYLKSWKAPFAQCSCRSLVYVVTASSFMKPFPPPLLQPHHPFSNNNKPSPWRTEVPSSFGTFKHSLSYLRPLSCIQPVFSG